MSHPEKRKKFLHHLGVGAGFVGLVAWFFAGRQLGILDWAGSLAPEGYGGAALMLGIMIMMTPAFALWTVFNRWLERKLSITGRYMEDDVYLPPKKR